MNNFYIHNPTQKSPELQDVTVNPYFRSCHMFNTFISLTRNSTDIRLRVRQRYQSSKFSSLTRIGDELFVSDWVGVGDGRIPTTEGEVVDSRS